VRPLSQADLQAILARLLDLLERQGWAVLHDLAVPGSRANIDHLVTGPAGVFVIDSQHYRGRLRSMGLGGYGMAAIRSPPRCVLWTSRRTGPPRSWSILTW
jgi:Nuclease-related domain